MTKLNDGSGLARWHGPALGFFGIGLVAGALCATAGPVVGIRLLGAIAMVSSAMGLALVAYTWRCEDPAAWESATWRARAWRASAMAWWRHRWARRLTLDRYLQNLVWSGMD